MLEGYKPEVPKGVVLPPPRGQVRLVSLSKPEQIPWLNAYCELCRHNQQLDTGPDCSRCLVKPDDGFKQCIPTGFCYKDPPTDTGKKDDDGKSRYDLLPFPALESVVRVLTWGAKHYGDDNWREVKNARKRYLAAAFRHLTAWARGEGPDKDTGESHLAHAVCCLLFLMSLGD